MILGSNRQNITILSVFLLVTSFVGLFYFDFTVNHMLLTLLFFYIYNILGNWMTLHRYYAHKSFEFKNNYLKYVFTIIALLTGRGSILGWVYIHRLHHAHADTDIDPHSPKYLGFKLFGFGHYKKLEEENMKLFLVKDLMTKDQLFYHKYYIGIILLFLMTFISINMEYAYFCWILPCLFVQISQNTFNYFGHMRGYRNFHIKDNSTNNFYLFPLILGECWHNNHHANPKDYSTKINANEVDPLGNFIKLVGYVRK
jgi:stearoyl-CoA desaturase (delta-9 desaturase)